MAGSADTGAAGTGKRGGNLVTVASATALVGTEAFATAIAAGWALAGLLHLGDAGEYALMALFSVGAAYMTFAYYRRARTVEASGV